MAFAGRILATAAAVAVAQAMTELPSYFDVSVWGTVGEISPPLTCDDTTREGIPQFVDHAFSTEGCNCNEEGTHCSNYVSNGDGTYAVTFYTDNAPPGCGPEGISAFFPRAPADGSCMNVTHPCVGAVPATPCNFALRLLRLAPPPAVTYPWTSTGELIGSTSNSDPACQCIAETFRTGGSLTPSASGADMTVTLAPSCGRFIQSVGIAKPIHLKRRSPRDDPRPTYTGSTGTDVADGMYMHVKISPTTVPHKSWAIVYGVKPGGGIICKTTMTSWGL